MNKSELIEKVAAGAELNKKAAAAAVNATFDAIAAALAEGDKVAVLGFGTFETRERAARVGRNPQSGDPVDIPASKSPAFKAGKALKDAVNK